MLCLMRRQAVEPEAEGVEFRTLGMVSRAKGLVWLRV